MGLDSFRLLVILLCFDVLWCHVSCVYDDSLFAQTLRLGWNSPSLTDHLEDSYSLSCTTAQRSSLL